MCIHTDYICINYIHMYYMYMRMSECSGTQLCLTLWDPMNCIAQEVPRSMGLCE